MDPAAFPSSTVNEPLAVPLAREICSAFDLHGPVKGDNAPLRAGCGFSGAGVYRWTDDRGDCWAWRSLPDQTADEIRIRQIARWATCWRDAGLPIAVFRPVASRESQRIGGSPQYLFRPHRRPLEAWLVEPWLPGTADYSTDPSPGRLDDTMRSLARLHLATGRASSVQKPDRFAPAGLLKRCSSYGDGYWASAALGSQIARIPATLRPTAESFREIAAKVGPAIMRDAEAACRLTVPAVVCVRDLWHDHLLFTGHRLTGLIDLHSADRDCVASDLTRLLGSLHPFSPGRWMEAISIYEQVRPLVSEERLLLRHYERTSVLLSGIYWLTRWVERSQTSPTIVAPHQVSRELARLSELLQRMIAPSPLDGLFP